MHKHYNGVRGFSQVVRYVPRPTLRLGAAIMMIDSVPAPPRTGRLTESLARCFCGTTVMGLLAGTAGLKRHISITMEFKFASQTMCA